jgi:hypothetical protein
VINLAAVKILLPLRTQLLTGFLVWLPVRSVPGHVAWLHSRSMYQKLDLPKEQHSTSVGLPDKKPTAHSSWAAAPMDVPPAARDGTLEFWDATSKSWDAAKGIGNAGSETVGMGLASLHDMEIRI